MTLGLDHSNIVRQCTKNKNVKLLIKSTKENLFNHKQFLT